MSRLQIPVVAVSSACMLVALSALAFAQTPNVECKATETQAECHARLKCRANEEIEACQRRLLKCKADEKIEDCKKRAAAQGGQQQGQGQQGQQGQQGGGQRDDTRGDDRGDRRDDRRDDRGDDRGDDRRDDRRDDRGDDRGDNRRDDRGDDRGDRGDDGRRGRDRGDDGGGRRRGRARGGEGGRQSAKTFGLGLELGEPSGLNGKFFFAQNTAIDFGIGWIYQHYYYGDGVHLYGDVLFHFPLTSGESFEVPLYLGPGLRFWDFDYCHQGLCTYGGSAIGIRVPVGISFDFTNAPLDIFLQIVPVLDFVRGDYYRLRDRREHFGFDASLGIRFWFK